MYKKLEKCLKSIREKTDFKPEKAVILGSGLGDYAEKIKIEKIVKYTDIEGLSGIDRSRTQRTVCVRICERCPGRTDAGKSALL